VVINSMPFALNLCFVLMCFFASKIKMQSIGCTLSLKEKSKCEIFECTAAAGGAASDEVHYAHHPPLLNSYLGVVKQVLHRSKRDNRLYAIKVQEITFFHSCHVFVGTCYGQYHDCMSELIGAAVV
jgi:hypothetical protein